MIAEATSLYVFAIAISECEWTRNFSLETRMHSSGMRTARSSSRPGVSTRHPPEQVPTPPDQAPPHQAPPRTRHPPGGGTPPCGQTHTCKHITLPQTSFAGGNKTDLRVATEVLNIFVIERVSTGYWIVAGCSL